jgi:hypothetical protein
VFEFCLSLLHSVSVGKLLVTWLFELVLVLFFSAAGPWDGGVTVDVIDDIVAIN